MRIVDIFLAAPKTEARGVIATLLGAHGFRVRWQTPWQAQGDRGSSFGPMFSPGNPLAVKFTVGVEVGDRGADGCVLRLERRYIPIGQNLAEMSLKLADEFENLCDEVMLAFSAEDQVTQVVTYGAGSLLVVDPHLAKPPPPIVPTSHAVAAAHAPPAGPPWIPQAVRGASPGAAPNDDTVRASDAFGPNPGRDPGSCSGPDPDPDLDPGLGLGPESSLGPTPEPPARWYPPPPPRRSPPDPD